jgi:hypothetical protein
MLHRLSLARLFMYATIPPIVSERDQPSDPEA